MDVSESRAGRPSPVLIGVGAILALATLALIGYAALGGDRPVEPEPEEVALPTPREPVVRAFTAAAGARDAGWTWINPRPRAMPTWYAVAVGGPGLIAMVGQDGAAARFLAGSLVTWRTGTNAALRAIAWSAPDVAIAVGERGTIVRLTSQGPQAIPSQAPVDLRAVLPRTATEALIAGDAGTLLRVRGSTVDALASGTDAALLALHRRGDATWIVGERGTILRATGDGPGEITAVPSGTGVTLRAVGGCPRGDLYAAGDQATLVRRRADGTWQNVRTEVDSGVMFSSIACDRGRAAIVGSDGTVVLASGQNVVAIPSGFDRAFHGVAGDEGESTWIVGAGGRLATLEQDHVETRTSGPTVPLRDVGAIGGAIVAVGEWGRIVREREHGLEESESPTDAGLAALAPLDESRLLAVGDLGAIVEVTWQGARTLPSPTDASLRGVIAGADGRVVAVGTGGTLLRGGAESLVASRVPDVGDLWAIDGTPDDAIAVGDGATVVHVATGTAARWPCDIGGASLRAIARTPAGPIAVGEEGTIVRVSAGGCTLEHRGGPSLDAIVLGPDGRPLAVGEDGAAWARADDGSWSEAEVELGGNHARAARRIGRHVYEVGTGGAIVRHIVADGS